MKPVALVAASSVFVAGLSGAVAAQPAMFRLQWDVVPIAQPPVVGLQVQRCVVPRGQGSCIPTDLRGIVVAPSVLEYADTLPDPKASYCYRVLAYTAEERSTPSNALCTSPLVSGAVVAQTIVPPQLPPPAPMTVTPVAPQAPVVPVQSPPPVMPPPGVPAPQVTPPGVPDRCMELLQAALQCQFRQ